MPEPFLLQLWQDQILHCISDRNLDGIVLQRMSAGFTASGKGIVQGMQNLMVWFSYHVFGVIFLIAICAVIGIIVKRKNITLFYRKGRKKEE